MSPPDPFSPRPDVRDRRSANAELRSRLQSLDQHCLTDLLAGLEALRDGDLTFSGQPRTQPLVEAGDDGIAEAFNGVLAKAQRALAEYEEMRDRRAAIERELREANDRYRLVTEVGSDLIMLVDAEGTILYASPSYATHLGHAPSELVGRNARDFAHPDDVGAIAVSCDAHAPERERQVVLRYRKGDGGWAWLDAKVMTAPASEGQARRFVIAARDVTERLQAEAIARSREDRYSALLSQSTDLIALLNAEGEIVWQSPSGESLFGYDREEILGSSVFRLLHPDDLERGAGIFAGVLAEPEQAVTAEVRFQRGDGGWAVGECRVTNLLDDPAVAGVVVVTRDVTERAAAEEAVHASERRFRAVFEGSLDAMLLADDDRVLIDVNRAACDLFGLGHDEIVGRRQEEVTGAPVDMTMAAWREFLAAGVQSGESPLVRADGEQRIVEYRATTNVLPGQHLSVLRDVTARQQLEEQLRQSQKMEAIGQLAGGVAHDFNNLLTAISGYSALLSERRDLPFGARGQVEEIARAADRAAALTKQLLAFSRRQTLCPAVVDPNRLIAEAAPMLRRLIGEHIDFIVEPAADLRSVFADSAQIEQVLMNLVVNAAQAMSRGGTLVITTENATVDEQTGCVELADGDYVEISVTDTGCGMDACTLARAFEPFFTTKDCGTSTGLGLSTVHGIAKQSGGAVRIESTQGRGTTVTVYLPATDDVVALRSVHESAENLRGSGKVMLVDDNAIVRDVAAEMLRGRGYELLVAAGPEEALDLVERGARFDVLVSDVVMPKISGPELAARITKVLPGLQTVLTSGYAEHGLFERGANTNSVFLQKPFTADELAAAVRGILDRRVA